MKFGSMSVFFFSSYADSNETKVKFISIPTQTRIFNLVAWKIYKNQILMNKAMKMTNLKFK